MIETLQQDNWMVSFVGWLIVGIMVALNSVVSIPANCRKIISTTVTHCIITMVQCLAMFTNVDIVFISRKAFGYKTISVTGEARNYSDSVVFW